MLDFGIEFYIKQNTSDISKLKNELTNISKNSKSAESGINSLTSSIKGLAAAGAGFIGISMLGDSLKSITKDTITVAASFEKMKLTLDTLEGSSAKADASMSWIKDFAKSTPYEIEGITESFIRLKAYGLDPMNGLLRTLGDTSAAFGKPLISAVEAMADAVNGENERLKEFGIKAVQNGEKIGYSWTDSMGKARFAIVENNSKIIESTLSAIFNEKYAGNMDKQSKSFDGMISNIKDSYSGLQDKFMKETGLFDILKEEISIISEEFSKFGNNKQGMYDLANATRQFLSELLSVAEGAIFLGKSFSLGLGVVKTLILESWNGLKDLGNFVMATFSAIGDMIKFAFSDAFVVLDKLGLSTLKISKTIMESFQDLGMGDFSNGITTVNDMIIKSQKDLDIQLENSKKNATDFFKNFQDASKTSVDFEKDNQKITDGLIKQSLEMNNSMESIKQYKEKLQQPLIITDSERLSQELDIINSDVKETSDSFEKLYDDIEKVGETKEISVKVAVGKEGSFTDLKEEMKKTSDSLLEDLENYYTTMKDYEMAFEISVARSNQELIKRGALTEQQITAMNEKQKIQFDKDQKERIKSELKEQLDAKNEILEKDKEYFSVIKNYEEEYRLQLEQDKLKWQEMGLTQEQIQEMAIVKQKEYAEEAKKARDEDLKKIQTVENGITTFYRQLETETKNVSETTTSLLLDITDALNNGFVNFFDGTSKKFGDFKELTKSIFTDIIKSIQEMIIKMTVAQTMQYAMQSAGFGGGYSDKGSFSFSDFFGFAKGGAFSGGVQAFASGGAFTNSIATNPTLAPMALFGEAGPEAIMPLTRTSNGSLGVVAQTNGGANVIINNYSSSSISSSKDSKGNTVLTIEDVIGTVSKQLQSGRGAIADSLSSSYNVARR